MSHVNAALTPRSRLRLAHLVVEQEWPIARAAERHDVSWPTANRWANRYQVMGAVEGEPAGELHGRLEARDIVVLDVQPAAGSPQEPSRSPGIPRRTSRSAAVEGHVAENRAACATTNPEWSLRRRGVFATRTRGRLPRMFPRGPAYCGQPCQRRVKMYPLAVALEPKRPPRVIIHSAATSQPGRADRVRLPCWVSDLRQGWQERVFCVVSS